MYCIYVFSICPNPVLALEVGLWYRTLPANARDLRHMCLIPRWKISSEEGMANPFQYYFLKIPWTEEPRAIFHGVADLDMPTVTEHSTHKFCGNPWVCRIHTLAPFK